MMANLNFQQPPRSIANSSLSGRNSLIQNQNSNSSNPSSTTPTIISSSSSVANQILSSSSAPVNSNSGNVLMANNNNSSSNSAPNSSSSTSQQQQGSITTTNATNLTQNSNSLSGHVTPTSSMFSNAAGSNYGGAQLSPNRGMIGGGPGSIQSIGSMNSGQQRPNAAGNNTSNIFGSSQRAFNNIGNPARSNLMPNNSNMNSFMQQSRDRSLFGIGGGAGSGPGLQNYHSMFGIPGGVGGGVNIGVGIVGSGSNGEAVGGGAGMASTPPLLDLSEFPSLTNSSGANQSSASLGSNNGTSNGRDSRGGGGIGSAIGMGLMGGLLGDNSMSAALGHHQQHHLAALSNSLTAGLLLQQQQHHHHHGPSVSSSHNPLQAPSNKAYGMVKQPTSEQNEFQMSSEDFPALPGTQQMNSDQQHQQSSTPSNSSTVSGLLSSGIGGGNSNNPNNLDNATTNSSHANNSMAMDQLSESERQLKRVGQGGGQGGGGVQTSPDGKVTNIPASMVNNQFGMVGLLTFIRAAESDPNLVSLAMGQDLCALGLNLGSPENLYEGFGGPFVDQPCRPQDIDFHVPPEYLVNMSIREKLSQIQLKKYKDDLLFFLFYTNVGDVMQLAAAQELHSRDWRYHIEEKVWITRVPGITQYEKNGATERGTFYYFDVQNWRRVLKESLIDTGKLDKCPNLNSFMSVGQPV